jgi:hypothetical protein
MVLLGICVALLVVIAMCFSSWLVAVLATCAVLCVSVIYSRKKKLLRLPSRIPADAGQVLSKIDLKGLLELPYFIFQMRSAVVSVISSL